MIFSCPACGVQYDCERLEPGEVYRCSCGELIPVSAIKPRDLRVLYCPACGAPLRKGTVVCEYCGGAVSLKEKNLLGLCPACFTRLPNTARHCYNCGARVDPLKVAKAGSGRSCPRCDTELQAREYEGFNLFECRRCGGLWVSEPTFKEICLARQRHGSLAESLGQRAKPAEKTEADAVVYLKCPECRTLMNRRAFARRSGVIIDRCREHGIWLDCHELEAILKYIDAGGISQTRRAVAEEQNVHIPRTARSLFKPSRYGQVAFTGVPPPPTRDWLMAFIAELLD